jgi:arginyl-tRNA synthetase
MIIANNFSVHLLGEELIKFAKLIHNFYEKERILTIPLSERKLTFVKILKDTLGFLFDIINLPKLEKM